jgi:hypothetical protein
MQHQGAVKREDKWYFCRWAEGEIVKESAVTSPVVIAWLEERQLEQEGVGASASS